jgi:hypothetical protein
MMDYTPPPAPVAAWLEKLPSKYIGKLFATIRAPDGQIKEYPVKGWGQICDGRPHADMVHLMLYNYFPDRGRGYTYLSWRAEPDHPEANDAPRTGNVENPQPYDGIAYH